MFHKLVLRFKLNSIGYGPKLLGIIGLLTIALPSLLYGVYLALALWAIHADGILLLMKISWGLGGLLLGAFGVLLAIEFAQDRYLDAYYSARRQSRLRTPDGYHECQSCGCRRVREADRSCPVCGTTFVQD